MNSLKELDDEIQKERLDNGDWAPRVLRESITQLHELIDCEVRYK